MNSQTPIVFIHRGDSWYLPYVLSQAKFANPGSNITLIGDNLALQVAQGIKGVCTESLDNLDCDSINSFRQNYYHMSSNLEEFELFCWLRWFYLLEHMRRHHISTAFHCDSDVLLYSAIKNIKEIYGFEKNKACGFIVPKQSFDSFRWGASAHVSYWSNALLKEFCEFSINSFTEPKFLDLYKEKYNYHMTVKKPGGICDMTTLYLFWKWNEDRIENLAVNHDANVIDNNINSGLNYDIDEYAVDANIGIKKVKFIRGCPFLFPSDNSGTLARVHALHFQGGAKHYIREFSTYAPLLRPYFKSVRYLKALKSYMKNKVSYAIKTIVGSLLKVVVAEKS